MTMPIGGNLKKHIQIRKKENKKLQESKKLSFNV